MALLPLAVRLASTFLQKHDIQTSSNSQLNSKSSIETVPLSKEEPINIINTNIKYETESIDDTASSNNFYYEFEQILSSSSSELDLSIALQNDTSSLSLTILDNQHELTTDDSVSLTPTQLTSDNESVLYLRLEDELNIGEATLDSDLEKTDR
jgi:hypothetical protein